MWYKPYILWTTVEESGIPDLLEIPGDIAMRLEMELGFDEWPMDLYNCFSGNKMASPKFQRAERLTWEGFHLTLRHHLLDKA